ncbi:hypothetical protein ACFQ2K_10035 [Streptomyces sanglieri]|uniref:Uncharacterized protein n=1 Tax=Streptomyces sanglieri TaxID=193460 RepID=A0ABW2WNW9_9ACTN
MPVFRRLPHRSHRALTALLATACVAGTLGIPTVAAAEAPTTRATQSQHNGPVVAAHTITLVTGEVVTLDRYANGVQAATACRRPTAPRRRSPP